MAEKTSRLLKWYFEQLRWSSFQSQHRSQAWQKYVHYDRLCYKHMTNVTTRHHIDHQIICLPFQYFLVPL